MKLWIGGWAMVIVAAAAAVGQMPTRLAHRQESFTIQLNGSVPQMTPLFGPLREAEWSPGWKPRFVHPPDPKQVEGAIFTTETAEGLERIWILTAYDEAQGRAEYVVVTPGLTANRIRIRLVPFGNTKSVATITYEHTALSARGNGDVEKLDHRWAEKQQAHWQDAINRALEKEAEAK